jgi:hypothetical protein
MQATKRALHRFAFVIKSRTKMYLSEGQQAPRRQSIEGAAALLLLVDRERFEKDSSIDRLPSR